MKFTQPLHLHLGNILYKYGLNPSLDNKVMNLYFTGYRRVRRTSRAFLLYFSKGWSNVLSIPTLHKLQRYQILLSIC